MTPITDITRPQSPSLQRSRAVLNLLAASDPVGAAAWALLTLDDCVPGYQPPAVTLTGSHEEAVAALIRALDESSDILEIGRIGDALHWLRVLDERPAQ